MAHFLETWGYLAIFVLSLISSFGIPVGAEFALLYGGVLASGHAGAHDIKWYFVILVAVVAELIGSIGGYYLGYLGGRPLVDRFGKYLLLTHKDLDRAEAWFGRHGDPVVVFGRLVPLIRSFVSFASGLTEMALSKFIAFSLIGITIWCTAQIMLGYALGGSYEKVNKAFNYAGYVFAGVAIVAIAVLFWHRWRSVKAEQS